MDDINIMSCNRLERRSTNGVVVPIEGVPRKASTSIKSTPSDLSLTTFVSSSPDQQQQRPLKMEACEVVSKQECKDFDDVMERVGKGKYQERLLYFVISPFSVIQPILAYNAVFMLFVPHHWCSSPDIKKWDDQEEYKLVNIPMVNGTDGFMKYSSCEMYGPHRAIIECPFGWQYDKTFYNRTLISDNDWVCEKSPFATWILLGGTVGNALGTLLFGMFSDKWGRKPALLLALGINIVFRLLSLFTGEYWYLHLVCQFFVGSTTTSLYVGSALIVAELCNSDDRGEVYAVTWTICLGGFVVLPFIAWLCADWFYIGLVTVGIGCCMLGYFPIIPESPRWLLQKGKVDEAAQILKKVQDYNRKHDKKNKKVDSLMVGGKRVEGPNSRKSCDSTRENNVEHFKSMLKQVLERQHNREESASIAEGRGAQREDRSKATVLLRKKNLAKNTLLLTVCWSMNTLIYSTMTYNSTHMSGSHFKNFFLLGIIEAPSGFLGGYMADTLGRRWTQAGSFGLCALLCFMTCIMVHHREIEILLATLSKMVATVSFLVVYCQATELFPTELRSTGGGIASTVGNIVCVAAPVIAELSQYGAGYPWFVMGICAAIGTVAAAFLPETLNLRLPETIEEADNIGKNRRFWSIVTPEMKKKRKDVKVPKCEGLE